LERLRRRSRWTHNGSGKIVIEKTPEGFVSPDRADAVCIAFNPTSAWMETWLKL